MSEGLEYLATLSEEQRRVVSTLRDVVRAHLPDGVVETIVDATLVYRVSDEYMADQSVNGPPPESAALRSEYGHASLNMTGLVADPNGIARFREEWATFDKPIDMDGACLRITRTSDVPLVVIGDAITRHGPEELLAGRDGT